MKPKLCKVCNKELPSRKQTYCSYQCSDQAKKTREKKAKWNKQRGITTKKLDKLWSESVRKRDGKCMYCGSKDYLNAHHIFSRSNRSTRWDINNGITLCSGHHKFSSTFSAHKTHVEFTYWLEEKLGRDFLNDLRIKARSINKDSLEDHYNRLNLSL
jgi:5-methylcytosine-specific restriction endonuclease McrA